MENHIFVFGNIIDDSRAAVSNLWLLTKSFSKVLCLVFIFLGIKTFPKLNKTIRNEFPIKFDIGIIMCCGPSQLKNVREISNMSNMSKYV